MGWLPGAPVLILLSTSTDIITKRGRSLLEVSCNTLMMMCCLSFCLSVSVRYPETTEKGGVCRSNLFWKSTAWVWRVWETTFLRNPWSRSAFPFEFCNPTIRKVCAWRRNFAVPCLGLEAQRWPFLTVPALGSYCDARTEKIGCLKGYHYSTNPLYLNITDSAIASQNVQHSCVLASLYPVQYSVVHTVSSVLREKLCAVWGVRAPSPYRGVSIVAMFMLRKNFPKTM